MSLHDPLTRNDVVLIICVMVVAYIYVIVISPMIEAQESGWMYHVQTGCALECEHHLCKAATQGRGEKYFLGQRPNSTVDNEKIQGCFLTFWASTHFLMHFLLGILIPKLQAFYVTFVAGVLFEVYEFIHFRCHDPFDVICNTAGWWLGYSLRQALCTQSKS